jgi:AcrR family transcriptional regulator
MTQQQRGSNTRKKLVDAAARLFAERGYNSTSTTDILEAAGVTRGALYHHYTGKEHLKREIAATVVQAQEITLHPPKRKLKVQSCIAMTGIYARALRDSPIHQAISTMSIDGSYPDELPDPWIGPRQAVLKVLQEAKDHGELLETANVEEFAFLLQGAYTGVQVLSDVMTRRRDIEERIGILWRYFVPSLVLPGLLPHLVIPDPLDDVEDLTPVLAEVEFTDPDNDAEGPMDPNN